MGNSINVKEIIESIMKKYNVGRRPLSLILGFGEIQITRYLNGDNKPDEDTVKFLKSILDNPTEYNGYLEKNKDNKSISQIAYNKSKKAVESLLNKEETDDVLENVTTYIISKDIGLTNLKLQKLLYYCQLFSYVLYEKPLFKKKMEAWQHGPVYSDIYFEYKNFGDKEIYKNVYEFNISDENKALVDEVIDTFGVYSGNVLCYFTHSEEPWKESYNECKNTTINEYYIIDYSSEIKEKYNINQLIDIEKYTNVMLTNFKNRK